MEFRGFMIVSGELTPRPLSGDYDERIYDREYLRKSDEWTWILFTNEDYFEWYGAFRGGYIAMEISGKYNSILVLTTCGLFHLDKNTGDIVSVEENDHYKYLRRTPSEDFIIAGGCFLEIFTDSIVNKTAINLPEEVDYIMLHNWEGHKLLISGEVVYNWDNVVEFYYDSETGIVEYTNPRKKKTDPPVSLIKRIINRVFGQ